MKRILLDCWNATETKGKQCENNFSPICFVESDTINVTRGTPLLIELRKKLVFTVVTRIIFNDDHFDEIKEHMDRQLFDLVVGPIRKCVFDLADCVYARDFEGSIKKIGLLKDLVTNGQSALDKQSK